MAPRAPRPDADVSFPSHYTSRHYLLRLPRKSRPILSPSLQISSFSASWSFPPVLGLKGGLREQGAYWFEVRRALGANWPEGGGALARLRGE